MWTIILYAYININDSRLMKIMAVMISTKLAVVVVIVLLKHACTQTLLIQNHSISSSQRNESVYYFLYFGIKHKLNKTYSVNIFT